MRGLCCAKNISGKSFFQLCLFFLRIEFFWHTRVNFWLDFEEIEKSPAKKALKTDSNYIDRAFARWRNSDFEVSEKKTSTIHLYLCAESSYTIFIITRERFVGILFICGFSSLSSDLLVMFKKKSKKNQIEELLALIMMKM